MRIIIYGLGRGLEYIEQNLKKSTRLLDIRILLLPFPYLRENPFMCRNV